MRSDSAYGEVRILISCEWDPDPGNLSLDPLPGRKQNLEMQRCKEQEP